MSETEQKPVVLRYRGDGRFQPGIPARDLTTDDLQTLHDADDQALAAHAEMVKAVPKGEEVPEAPTRRDRRWLLKSGLYEPVEAPAKET